MGGFYSHLFGEGIISKAKQPSYQWVGATFLCRMCPVLLLELSTAICSVSSFVQCINSPLTRFYHLDCLEWWMG